MNLTLGKNDRRAVDLVLDRTAKAAGNDRNTGHPIYASADPSLGQRIAQAQRLLQLLDMLPGIDPPADLVEKTLRYVDEFSSRPAQLRQHLPVIVGSSVPHA